MADISENQTSFNIFKLLKEAWKNKNTNISDICIQLEELLELSKKNNYDMKSYNSYETLLFYALQARVSIDIIKLIYKYDNRFAYTIGKEIDHIWINPNRTVKYINTNNYVLAYLFGHVMINMYDTDIEIINYIEKCLEIFNINETDVDWDIFLKNGLNE